MRWWSPPCRARTRRKARRRGSRSAPPSSRESERTMRLRLDKPWQKLTAETATRLPGQLGVYQVADAQGTVLYIGQAGARSPFGLRSELQREHRERGDGCQFRDEVNQQY